MDSEDRTKWINYTVLYFVVLILAVHCSDVLRHSSHLLTNSGHSEWVYKARFYFLVLMGIAVIITQNVFIRKALKRMEDKKANRNQE